MSNEVTPINFFITKELPVELRWSRLDGDFCVMHIGMNIADSFIGMRTASKKYGSVWLFFSTCEIPSALITNKAFLGEKYQILFLSDVNVHRDIIWAEVSRRARKILKTKIDNNAAFSKLHQIMNSVMHFMPFRQDAKRIVSDAYNYQFPVETEGGAMSDTEDEDEVKLIIDSVINKSQGDDIKMLSGYERESRFNYSEAWDFAINRITNAYVHGIVAYYVPHDADEMKDLMPIGYIVGVNGDHTSNDMFELGIPKGKVSVISFAVNAKARRQKVATAMFQHLFLEVDKPIEVNIPFSCVEAAQLMKSLGFNAPCIREVGEDSFLIFGEENPLRLASK